MLKPLSKRVVLELIKEEEKKVGSLLLPGSAKVDENIAKVVAVATDVESVSVGEVVVFEQFAGLSVSHDGQDFIVIKEEHLVAVMN